MVKQIDTQDNRDTQGNWGQRAVSLPWALDLNCVVHDFDLWSSFDFTNFASCGMAYPPSLANLVLIACITHSTFCSLDLLYFRSCWSSVWSQPYSLYCPFCLKTHSHTPLIKLTPYSIKEPGPYLDMLYITFHAMLSISLVSHLPKSPGTVFCFTIPFLSCLMSKCL